MDQRPDARAAIPGLIRGIGPVYATRLVRLFGTDVFDIIEASPARLREVAGIGPKRADRITAAWADQKRIREIMVFLHQHGVGTARLRGIGFRTADLIAERLGIEKTASPARWSSTNWTILATFPVTPR